MKAVERHVEEKWMEINHPSSLNGTRMILYATVKAAKERSFCLKY